jgi:hypothetical protein
VTTPPPPPPLDPVASLYVTLAYGIERHIPGYVDAYVGPPDERAAAASGPTPEPARLLDAARALAVRVAEAAIPETRIGYLTAQIAAMTTTCRKLAGEEIAYADEVRLLFDIEPTRTPESSFEAAITALADLLPGTGDVAARMSTWRRQHEISPDTARRLTDLIVPEIRRRSTAIVDLPAGEGVEFRFVSDQPWSGYNWFLGGGRSRVELNTDLPLHSYRLPNLLCQEAYPGHHAEHTLKGSDPLPRPRPRRARHPPHQHPRMRRLGRDRNARRSRNLPASGGDPLPGRGALPGPRLRR